MNARRLVLALAATAAMLSPLASQAANFGSGLNIEQAPMVQKAAFQTYDVNISYGVVPTQVVNIHIYDTIALVRNRAAKNGFNEVPTTVTPSDPSALRLDYAQRSRYDNTFAKYYATRTGVYTLFVTRGGTPRQVTVIVTY